MLRSILQLNNLKTAKKNCIFPLVSLRACVGQTELGMYNLSHFVKFNIKKSSISNFKLGKILAKFETL